MNNGTLRIVEGDATNPQTTTPNEIVVIAHLCNNENKWGAGFVLALNEKWSLPEKVYRQYCDNNLDRRIPLPILGKVCYAKVDTCFIVANMIGQRGTFSRDNPIPIRYKALVSCMAEVANYIDMIQSQTSNPIVIHCPKFGSDLAKGNWDFILELIRELWLEQGIDVVVYEFKK